MWPNNWHEFTCSRTGLFSLLDRTKALTYYSYTWPNKGLDLHVGRTSVCLAEHWPCPTLWPNTGLCSLLGRTKALTYIWPNSHFIYRRLAPDFALFRACFLWPLATAATGCVAAGALNPRCQGLIAHKIICKVSPIVGPEAPREIFQSAPRKTLGRPLEATLGAILGPPPCKVYSR